MQNLNPDEEARITGNAYGAVAIIGNPPSLGNTVTVTVSATGVTPQTVTYAVSAADLNSANSALNIVAGLSALVNTNSVLTSAGFYAVAPFGSGPFAQNVFQYPVAEFAVIYPSSFTLTASSTGSMSAVVTANGVQLGPSSTVDSSTTPPTVMTGYLPILNYLEGVWTGSSQNLDTARADVWWARMDEPKIRLWLYNKWRLMLAEFLGIPLNPNNPAHALSHGLHVKI